MQRILSFGVNVQRLSACNSKIVLLNNYINTCRSICCAKADWQKADKNVAAGQQTKKKTPLIPKVTLIAQNQSISITTLEEAQKLAKRRDLQLVQVQKMDTKTQRPVYKLATTAEILNEESQGTATKQKSKDTEQDLQMKSEKSLTIGARISEHDLASRLKQISKWLSKSHVVRILIQGSADESTKLEHVFKTIEKSVKEPEVIGKIAQKHGKGSMLKFNILPAPKPKLDKVCSEATTTTNVVTSGEHKKVQSA